MVDIKKTLMAIEEKEKWEEREEEILEELEEVREKKKKLKKKSKEIKARINECENQLRSIRSKNRDSSGISIEIAEDIKRRM